MIYDLHIHSKYSYDSFLSPEKILKIAKKRGLDGVAITDHGTIKGGFETFKENRDSNFHVIVGAEIKTEYGDLIGLFLNEELESNKFSKVIEEIKSQGGLSVLAHPYRQYKFPEKFVNEVDIIEGFNARSKIEDNVKALKLAKRFGKPIIAGSDSHAGFEIGRGKTIIECQESIYQESFTRNLNIEGKESNYYLSHGLSIINESLNKLICRLDTS
jgi:predicted metal-dependent phosphoesterase TrpH